MPISMSPPQVIPHILCWISQAASLVARFSLGSLILGTAFLLAVAVYRLFLHPLSRIPGPRLAAVTNCWLAYHVRNGHMLRLGKTLHTEYGPAVRVGPNEVWFNTKDAFRLIYSKPLAILSYSTVWSYLHTCQARPTRPWSPGSHFNAMS